MKKITTLKQLNKQNETQYKNRSVFIDYVNTKHTDLENFEIYQIYSYNTIIAYYNKTNNKIIFTEKRYSMTTTKQTTQLINENNLTKQTINKTFSNWTTYEDLNDVVNYLI